MTAIADGFKYKGFTYTYDLDIEPEENCKIMQEAIMPNGKRIHMPWSPYSHPTQEDFCLWIDLGCPENIGNGNNNREDLDYIKGAGLITWTFDLKSRDSDWSRQGVRVTAGSERLVREIAAKTWPHSDVLNLEVDITIASQIELYEMGEAIERGEAG